MRKRSCLGETQMEPSVSYLVKFVCILSLLFLVNADYLKQYEGDVCKTDPKAKWTCKRIQDCSTALKKIRTEKPKICSFDGFVLIVCCEPESDSGVTTPAPAPKPKPPKPKPSAQTPTNTEDRLKSKSAQKCHEYAKYVYDKPVSSSLGLFGSSEEEEEEDKCASAQHPLIVGGEPTVPREFPHQVNIGYRYGNGKKWLCTGTLISENYVLSAAHCSRAGSFGVPKYAVIGDYDIATDTDDAEPEERFIVQVIDHPDYRVGAVYNDIALYRLDKNVTLNPYRRPACLHTGFNIKENSAIATGWGDTIRNGPRSTLLLKVILDFISYENCSKFWSSGVGIRRGVDDDSMICAGNLLESKDTCQGDSGGPLQVYLKEPYCMYSIVGVTSFGKECGIQIPGIYTRVSNYIGWIESVVWP